MCVRDQVPDIGELPLGNSHCMIARIRSPVSFVYYNFVCHVHSPGVNVCAAGGAGYSALWVAFGRRRLVSCVRFGRRWCLFYLVRATAPLSCCHVILVVPGPAITNRSKRDSWGTSSFSSSRLRLFFQDNTTISIFRTVEYSFDCEYFALLTARRRGKSHMMISILFTSAYVFFF